MKILKKSEGGSGGRRGHSGMCHWDETAVVKNDARAARRANDVLLCQQGMNESLPLASYSARDVIPIDGRGVAIVAEDLGQVFRIGQTLDIDVVSPNAVPVPVSAILEALPETDLKPCVVIEFLTPTDLDGTSRIVVWATF
jgi:hypothetical protein